MNRREKTAICIPYNEVWCKIQEYVKGKVKQLKKRFEIWFTVFSQLALFRFIVMEGKGQVYWEIQPWRNYKHEGTKIAVFSDTGLICVEY